MADVKRQSDGPAPTSIPAFDLSLLPDYNNDFITESDLEEFARALAAPENSPSTEDLTSFTPQRTFTALNDWRPIHQRVRPRNKQKKPPKRGKDETREGFVYNLLKWPMLLGVFGWLLFLSIAYALTRLYIYLYEHWVTWRGRRERLRKEMQKTNTYEEWIGAAKELDTYLGNDQWKKVDEYAYYDSKTIKRVLGQMVKLRTRAERDESGRTDGRADSNQLRPVEELRDLLQACVKNNFVGFENPRLYSETYYGTKNMVQNFVDEVENSLSFLLRTTQLDQESKRNLFKHASTHFGRTALCLSGGATFAYYHFGVAKALLDAGLMPGVLTGTSGGALVAAMLGTRTDEELRKLLVPALAHRITAAHDDMLTWFKRWYKTGARFDSVDWARRCAWFTRGSMTFREAYERTGRILNVSCVPSDPHSPTYLANYVTSPDCVIWSAVLASAAVPGILNPVVLMKKNRDGTLAPYSFGHKWKDGSLRTDIPLKALNLHFNVRFSIVSQVNPHINLFFFSSRGSVGRPVTHRRGRGWRGGFLGSALEQYIKLDLTKWLKVLRHLELLPRPLGQDWSEVWLQRFSGTVTIWPKTITSDFYYILSDPTPQRLARMIHAGQLSAFPKLKFIANRAKWEKLIRQGRRQTRQRSTDGGHMLELSEDELHGLRRPTRSRKNSSAAEHYPVEDSDSEDSRPGSPEDMPRFSFIQSGSSNPSRAGGAALNPSPEQMEAPDSPTITQRLSGWWSSVAPIQSSTRRRPQKSHDVHGAGVDIGHSSSHRPASMFEFGSALPEERMQNFYNRGEGPKKRRESILKEIKYQSRVLVDDSESEFEEGDDVGGFGDGGAEDREEEEEDSVIEDEALRRVVGEGTGAAVQ